MWSNCQPLATNVAMWPDMDDQWMSGSIGLRQRMVSRANSKKATEARDLIKVTVNLHAIALGHFGNKIAPVALSIALNAGDLVKKGR